MSVIDEDNSELVNFIKNGADNGQTTSAKREAELGLRLTHHNGPIGAIGGDGLRRPRRRCVRRRGLIERVRAVLPADGFKLLSEQWAQFIWQPRDKVARLVARAEVRIEFLGDLPS